MAEVTLEGLRKNYGNVAAVKGLDLVIKDQEFVVLLGPSGCGKTTTLRCITGLESPTGGRILFDGKDVTQQKPAERNVAMVFQFFALYPHLKARKIITFPLRARKASKKHIREKVEWVAEMFKLHHLLDRYVGGMPPGDKQKIALARAVVRDPNVLLLDEPLSALDEQYREEMRWQLGHIQKQLKVTTVYVTHDQREAMSLADRIILMRDGRIEQQAPPDEIYRRPANVFAAYFIGSPGMNLFPVTLEDRDLLLGKESRRLPIPEEIISKLAVTGRREFVMGIRPEFLSIAGKEAGEGESCFPATIFSTEQVGNYKIFNFRVDDEIYHGMVRRKGVLEGEGMVCFDMAQARFFNKESGEAIF
ncbi:MAG: ABC transporter ATP-binding protein [Deltaproteobacteria bacterium]|nr:ABC transporter ATP-binding protein [Deltaproteobacteria bacterium]